MSSSREPEPKHSAKYPHQLYTVEWHLGGSPELPILHRSYTNEPTARQIMAHATESMRKWPGAILRLRLWHRGALLATISPNGFDGRVEALPRVAPIPNRGWHEDTRARQTLTDGPPITSLGF